MDKIIKKAYGKINLGLDVLRRRPDGYHDVKMIMQTVDIYDELTFTKRDDDKISITTNREELPLDDGNLIYKAAKLIFKHAGVEKGVSIHLDKNIPIAAGMAGGSTDAAATLLGLNELFELHISTEDLLRIGVKIGADVPYCIVGGTALSEGIGEVLTPLKKPPYCDLLIAKPDINVSTKYVYEHLELDKLEKHPDIDGMCDALENGDLEGIVSRLANVLESVTVQKYGIIQEIKDKMLQMGAKGAIMSGSGPTVFGFFNSEKDAQLAKEAICKAEMAKEVFVTRFYPSDNG